MAANLNRPADFLGVETPDAGLLDPEQGLFLLPPSAFEKPVAASHGKQYKLQQEIKQLEEENEKLRSAQSKFQVPVQNPGLTTSSLGHYADELIKRQSEEIAELRSELMKLRQSYEQDSFEWDKKLRVCEENHEQELNRVLKQSRLSEEHLEEKVDRLSAELQKTLESSDRQSIEWQEKFESVTSSLKQRLEEVENEKMRIQRNSETKIMEMEIDIRNKTQVIEEQTEGISRLKTYIGEKESSQKSMAVWNVEKDTLENRLKVAQAENQKWQSQLELMNVRFTSMAEILTLQEGDISKAKKEGLGKAKQHGIILNKWREKVFVLLVQQKSSEISYKNLLNKAQDKILQLEDERDAQIAQEEVLQHSLRDKEAQLQMEAQNNKMLQEDLSEAKQVANCLDDQAKENGISLHSLKIFMDGMLDKYDSSFKILEDKSNQLKVLCQRVSFAAGRMELLKSQIVRQTAMITNPLSSNTNNDWKKSRSMSVSRGDEDVSRDSEEVLYQELERVMRERDSLVSQVRDDSTKWSNKLTATRTQYHTELSTLKKTVEDLEWDIQQKTKKCVNLTEELDTLRETDKEKDDTILQLQAELARHAKGSQSLLTDQRLKDEELHQEKMADLERELNESKREHAKTVVSFRQLERNHSREMERSKDLLTTTEEHLNSQIIQLRNQLMSLEKERNTLVATLRQEGLLSKLKSDRPEAIHLALDEHQVDQKKNVDEESFPLNKVHQDQAGIDSMGPLRQTRDDDSKKTKSDSQGPDIVSARGMPEPVENVIKDLKSLTAAIFDDDSDEDNETKEDSFQ